MVDGVGVEPTMPELQSGVLPFYDPSRRKLVGRDGFEPPIFRVSAEGSNQLSYLPMEGMEGIGPPFADLQSAAKASIDNMPNGCGWRNRTSSFWFRARRTTVMRTRILKMASTSRIELLSTVLETVAQPLYHVLMVLAEGFEPTPRRTCS